MKPSQLRAHLRSLAQLADRIERLNPQLARGGLNVEYPWRDAGGRVRAPAKVRFAIAGELQTPAGCNLLKLVATFYGTLKLIPREGAGTLGATKRTSKMRITIRNRIRSRIKIRSTISVNTGTVDNVILTGFPASLGANVSYSSSACC